jgi:hypothetical protein
VCGKNNAIQKVSGVVASGQASGTFSGPSGGVVKVDGKWCATGGYTTLSGSTVSNLAALLSPPAAPGKWPFGFFTTVLSILFWWFVVLPLIGVPIGLLIVVVVHPENLSYLGWQFSLVGIFLGLLSMGVGILIIKWYVNQFRQARAAYPSTRAAWESAMQ